MMKASLRLQGSILRQWVTSEDFRGKRCRWGQDCTPQRASWEGGGGGERLTSGGWFGDCSNDLGVKSLGAGDQVDTMRWKWGGISDIRTHFQGVVEAFVPGQPSFTWAIENYKEWQQTASLALPGFILLCPLAWRQFWHQTTVKSNVVLVTHTGVLSA